MRNTLCWRKQLCRKTIVLKKEEIVPNMKTKQHYNRLNKNLIKAMLLKPHAGNIMAAIGCATSQSQLSKKVYKQLPTTLLQRVPNQLIYHLCFELLHYTLTILAYFLAQLSFSTLLHGFLYLDAMACFFYWCLLLHQEQFVISKTFGSLFSQRQKRFEETWWSPSFSQSSDHLYRSNPKSRIWPNQIGFLKNLTCPYLLIL